jgi:hypothetical protein
MIIRIRLHNIYYEEEQFEIRPQTLTFRFSIPDITFSEQYYIHKNILSMWEFCYVGVINFYFKNFSHLKYYIHNVH